MILPNNSSASKRLFVGSLPYRYSEGELLTLFVPFGRVISLKITQTPWGKNRGFGYVEFDNLESAVQAKNKLHNSLVNDRRIIVDYAKPNPAATPEGLMRHAEALQRNPRKFRPRPEPEHKLGKKHEFKHFDPSFKKPKPKTSPRQSVYDSRAYHSRVGAKFSAKNRSRK